MGADVVAGTSYFVVFGAIVWVPLGLVIVTASHAILGVHLAETVRRSIEPTVCYVSQESFAVLMCLTALVALATGKWKGVALFAIAFYPALWGAVCCPGHCM